MNDSSRILERILMAPKKTRQEALLAAESALAGNREVLLVTQAQAARAISCSRFTIRRLVIDGALHPVNIRGLVRYRLSELRALANGTMEPGGRHNAQENQRPKEGSNG